MTVAIRTDGLTRHFGPLRAVDEISMEVPLGVIFGFLGPNGAGKTTTIRLLLGLLEPTAGRRDVLGLDTATHSDRIREQTGALLEHAGLYERLSVEDNLEFYGRIFGLATEDRRARCKELLTRFGLWDRRRAPAGALSKGMKQKLAIARAFLHRPVLVFLDEPTSGLDPAAAVALRADLVSLASQEGVTIFLTSHNLAEVEKTCSLVAVIDRGRIKAFGELQQVLHAGARPHAQFVGAGLNDELRRRLEARPEVAMATLLEGGPGHAVLDVELRTDTSVAPLVDLLVNAGARLEEVRRVTPTLESAYLRYVDDRS
jgi:ABC-2 type transport system ATP-binding protein